MPELNRRNVGAIAERIVRNELEFYGFRTVDLNGAREVSENADILAARDGRTWQVQVKAMTHPEENENWCYQYGFCTQEMIDRNEPVFNRRNGFYRADVVVLLSVRTPAQYKAIILPIEAAEQAAQFNMDRYYRQRARNGEARKPHKMWVIANARAREQVNDLLLRERAILREFQDNWQEAFDR